MKHRLILILLISQLISMESCCKSDNDTTDLQENACPATNTAVPEILGDWIFTGTIIDGKLLVEDCDLKTKLTITKTQFIWDNYSGNNCNDLTVIPTCYGVEENIIFYYDDFGEKTGFSQKIKTLNDLTLILENIGAGTIVSTENYERIE